MWHVTRKNEYNKNCLWGYKLLHLKNKTKKKLFYIYFQRTKCKHYLEEKEDLMTVLYQIGNIYKEKYIIL